jgi:hypothetical protein
LIKNKGALELTRISGASSLHFHQENCLNTLKLQTAHINKYKFGIKFSATTNVKEIIYEKRGTPCHMKPENISILRLTKKRYHYHGTDPHLVVVVVVGGGGDQGPEPRLRLHCSH